MEENHSLEELEKELAPQSNGGEETMAKVTKEKPLAKNKIKCVKCGKVCGVRPDIRAQRVKKFGSEKALVEGYLCRTCRPKKKKAKKRVSKKSPKVKKK